MQRIDFLGLSVDSVTLCLALLRGKVRSIRKVCEGLIANPVATVRQLAHLLGRLSSFIQAVFPVPIYYRYLQQAKIQALHSGGQLRVSGLSEARGNRGIAVAGRAPYRLEWECQLQGGEYRRPMESFRTVSPHKLSGTSSKLLRDQMLRKGKNKHSHSAPDGHCDCTYIHQQNGGTKSRARASLSHDLWQWYLQKRYLPPTFQGS